MNLLFWSPFHSSCYREMFILIPFEEPLLWDTGVLHIPVMAVSSWPTKNNRTDPHPVCHSPLQLLLLLPPQTSIKGLGAQDECPASPGTSLQPRSRWRRQIHEEPQDSPSFPVITTTPPAAPHARQRHRAINSLSGANLTSYELIFLFYQNSRWWAESRRD